MGPLTFSLLLGIPGQPDLAGSVVACLVRMICLDSAFSSRLENCLKGGLLDSVSCSF